MESFKFFGVLVCLGCTAVLGCGGSLSASTTGAPTNVTIPPQPPVEALYAPQVDGTSVPQAAIVHALARAVRENSAKTSPNPRFGLAVRESGAGVSLVYTNADSQGKVTQTIGRYAVALAQESANTKASFIAPTEFINNIGRGTLFLAVAPLLDEQELAEEVRRIHANLRPVIYLDHQVKGEFDSEFPDSSVYANYVRTFGNRKGMVAIDIEKSITFCFERSERGQSLEAALNKRTPSRRLLDESQRSRFGDRPTFCENDQVPVSVAVYPYREGSKVKYSFSIAYSLQPDGTSTFAQAEVDTLERQIEAIAME